MLPARPVANHCLNVRFLRFMSDPVSRIQWPNWNVEKSTGQQWLGTKWMTMATMKYATSNIWNECEDQRKQNEKLSLEAGRVKQRKSDRMLAQIGSSWIWKETKRLALYYKQQGVLNNSQRVQFWFSLKKLRYLYFDFLKSSNNKTNLFHSYLECPSLNWMTRIPKKWMTLVTIQYAMPNIWSYCENRDKGINNQLSKPCGSIDENLTGCLQRYVGPGYKRNQKHLFLNRNNVVLQTIGWKDSCDFLRKNRDIDISTFPKCWTIKLVEFHDPFGQVIIHDAVKNAESSKDHR
jgi:hypothetical protein